MTFQNNNIFPPVYVDHRRGLAMHIYTDGNADPDFYWIWFDGRERSVLRRQHESPTLLYQRVCDEVMDLKRIAPSSVKQRSPMAGGPAYVFAGINPTEEQRNEIYRRTFICKLLSVSENSESHQERVDAACLLTEILGMMPPVVI